MVKTRVSQTGLQDSTLSPARCCWALSGLDESLAQPIKTRLPPKDRPWNLAWPRRKPKLLTCGTRNQCLTLKPKATWSHVVVGNRPKKKSIREETTPANQKPPVPIVFWGETDHPNPPLKKQEIISKCPAKCGWVFGSWAPGLQHHLEDAGDGLLQLHLQALGSSP